MQLKFRQIKKEEIEVRIARIEDGVTTLLLYQDARTTMNVFDEMFGPFNWRIEYRTVTDKIYGRLSIYDEDKCEWVYKEDTGTESKIQPEKGISSDILKRCSTRWGWARELYSAPLITVECDNKHMSYSVQHIAFDSNNRICELVIVNKFGVEVFDMNKPKNIVGKTYNKAVSQPTKHFVVKKFLEDDGETLTKAFFREIMSSNDIVALNEIWNAHPDLWTNKKFIRTVKNKKKAIESLVYSEN